MVMGLILAGVTALTGAGALWGTTAAAAHGRLRRNNWAGIRTAATQRSDEAWSAAHQAALPLCRFAGIASIVVAALMVVESVRSDDLQDSVTFWVLCAIGYGGIFVVTILAAVRASRAAAAA